MVSKDLELARKPLPPQRWGFLPTNEFWNRVARNPLALAVNGVGGIIYLWVLLFCWLPLTWWQQGIAAVIFFELWMGLFERWVRGRARRRALP